MCPHTCMFQLPILATCLCHLHHSPCPSLHSLHPLAIYAHAHTTGCAICALHTCLHTPQSTLALLAPMPLAPSTFTPPPFAPVVVSGDHSSFICHHCHSHPFVSCVPISCLLFVPQCCCLDGVRLVLGIINGDIAVVVVGSLCIIGAFRSRFYDLKVN